MGKLKKYCSLYLGFHKEFYKMKTIKIILVILLIVASFFVGYKLYDLYEQWQEKQYNEIEFLKYNQGLTLQKMTELSTTLTKVVNDTIKVQTEPKVDNTYQGLKEEVISLKENEEENKDKIEELREQLSEQRQNFLNSDDTILIKDIEGNSFLLYRDEDDVLQSASSNIKGIVEHRDVEDTAVSVNLEPTEPEKKKMNIKAGLYYDIIEKNYGGIISKQIIAIKDYSLNISLLSDMLSLEGLKIGADLGYNVSDFELGIGINHKKDIYVKFQYTF